MINSLFNARFNNIKKKNYAEIIFLQLSFLIFLYYQKFNGKQQFSALQHSITLIINMVLMNIFTYVYENIYDIIFVCRIYPKTRHIQRLSLEN